jgi:hypothetical protein
MFKSKTSDTIFDQFKDRDNKGFFGFGRKRRDDDHDVFGRSDDTDVFNRLDDDTDVFNRSDDGPDVFGRSDDGPDVFNISDDGPDGNDVFDGPGSSYWPNLPSFTGSSSSSTSSSSSSSSMSNWIPSGTTNFSSNNSFMKYIIKPIIGILIGIFSPFFVLYKSIFKGSSSSSSVGNGGYSFLNPSSLQLPSAVTLILILMVFIVLIIYWAYIKSNWEQVKCKDGRFWIAPLFGKSTQETIKDCTTKEIQITVNKNLQGEIERLADLDASVNELQTQINDSSGEATTLKDDTKSTLTNITNILESNINYVKGALSTILASIYISSNLNKGALTSYADLQKSDIAEIIDKYNNVNMNEANLNFI